MDSIHKRRISTLQRTESPLSNEKSHSLILNEVETLSSLKRMDSIHNEKSLDSQTKRASTLKLEHEETFHSLNQSRYTLYARTSVLKPLSTQTKRVSTLKRTSLRSQTNIITRQPIFTRTTHENLSTNSKLYSQMTSVLQDNPPNIHSPSCHPRRRSPCTDRFLWKKCTATALPYTDLVHCNCPSTRRGSALTVPVPTQRQ